MNKEDRPNILLIVADGMQGRVLRPGHECLTPHIDGLAERGVRVENAYTPLPTCSPARASLMTGLLPHNHGVLQVEHVVDDDQCVLRTDRPHWAQRLQAAGYRTGYYGKWHIERSHRPQDFGWQEHMLTGQAEHRRLSERGMSATVDLDPALTRYHRGPDGYNETLHYGVTDAPPEERAVSLPTDAACAYLETAPADEPWCCCASYYEPNEAMVVGREAFERYVAASLELPASLRDEHERNPGLYRRQRRIFAQVSDDEWRLARACYYGRISEIDDQVGRLLTVLEKRADRDRTVVVFTADHGKYVGGHGFEAHNFGAFEEIYNIPLVVAGPGIAEGAASKARVGLHDLCPTLLELAGGEAIDVPDSTSFVELLRDPAVCEDRFGRGYAEYHGTRFPLAQRIAWDGVWKFVFNGFDFDELYNLEEDPDELCNLAAEPGQEARVRRMMGQVWERVRETGDKPLYNTHYYSMRFAALGPEAELD